jgi:hypothetical protein
MRRTVGFALFSLASPALCACPGEVPAVGRGHDASTIDAGVADVETPDGEAGTSVPETGAPTPESGPLGDGSGDEVAPLPAIYRATQTKTSAPPSSWAASSSS